MADRTGFSPPGSASVTDNSFGDNSTVTLETDNSSNAKQQQDLTTVPGLPAMTTPPRNRKRGAAEEDSDDSEASESRRATRQSQQEELQAATFLMAQGLAAQGSHAADVALSATAIAETATNAARAANEERDNVTSQARAFAQEVWQEADRTVQSEREQSAAARAAAGRAHAEATNAYQHAHRLAAETNLERDRVQRALQLAQAQGSRADQLDTENANLLQQKQQLHADATAALEAAARQLAWTETKAVEALQATKKQAQEQ